MLSQYERIRPGFSVRDVGRRIRLAPNAVSCEGYLDGRASPSADAMPDDAYSAAIKPRCRVCPAAPGSPLQIVVDVTNLSSRPWPQSGIALSARIVRTSDGAELSGFDSRFPIGAEFSPRQSRQYVIQMKAPPTAGQYRLEVDLVQEMVAWFSSKHTKRGELLITLQGPGAQSSAARPAPAAAAAPPTGGIVYDCRTGTLSPSLVSGFHAPESWGMWSSADPAEVRFASTLKGPLRLTLVARALVKDRNRELRVTLGGETRTVRLGLDLTAHVLRFDARSGGDRIVFRGARPTAGSSLGIADPRPMGFALARIEIVKE
jgi:hypothetical protein